MGHHFFSRLIAVFFVTTVAIGLTFGSIASAQEESSKTLELNNSRQSIESLIQILENDAARNKLIEHLRAELESDQANATEEDNLRSENFASLVLGEISKGVRRISNQFDTTVDVLKESPRAFSFVWAEAQKPEVRQKWLEILSKIALTLAAGFFAEYVMRRLLRRLRRALGDKESDIFLVRIFFLFLRTSLDLITIGAFALASYGILPLTEPRPETRLVALALVNANVIARIIMAVARMILMPDAAPLRVFRIGDETAHYATIWVRRLVGLSIYGYFLSEAGLLLGLPKGAYILLLKLIGLLVIGLAIVALLQNRTIISELIRGRSDVETGKRFFALRERLADVWHVPAILLLLAVLGVWLLGVEGGFRFLAISLGLTALVIIVANLILLGLRKGLKHGFSVRDDLKLRYPHLEERVNQYISGLHRILRLLVQGISVLIILDIWFGEVFDWFTGEAGRSVIANIATVALILFAALVIWDLVTLLIERYLQGRESDDVEVERSARIRTLLPLFRNATRIVLSVIVILTVFSELGIDIAPLLAGAGVVGLAVGFGAQTLVKDVITGTFILVENSLAVGDWVDLANHSGTVEAMTIRTVTLRDREGTVHVVPFGEVTSVINFNRDYGYAMIDIGVAYREDVDEVIKTLEEVAEDMRSDETIGPSILAPLEVLGLNSLGESSVDIRVRLKTKAMMQWAIRREFLRRTKRVFDQRGIEIPFPHRTIYFGVDKEGKAPPAHVQQLTDNPQVP